jgi:hypothetical protein
MLNTENEYSSIDWESIIKEILLDYSSIRPKLDENEEIIEE